MSRLVLFIALLAVQNVSAGENSRLRTTVQQRNETLEPAMTAPPKKTLPTNINPGPQTKMQAKQPSLIDRIKQKTSTLFDRFWNDVTFQRCGNGTREGSEECDDGNTRNGDGCSCSCYNEPVGVESCGNGICETGELDPVSVNDEIRPRCPQDCVGISRARNPPPHTIVCGNCMIDGAGEECDDGNRMNTRDGCSNTCRISEDVRDERFCELPPDAELPSGIVVREYPSGRQISRCLGPGTARTAICGETEVTRNTFVCGEWYRCENGACIFDGGPFCTDSDGGRNIRTAGTVTMESAVYEITDPYASGGPVGEISETANTYTDSCSGDGAVNERYCVNSRVSDVYTSNCADDEHCEAGACVPGNLYSCTDTETGHDPHIRGTISGTTRGGTPFSRQDGCQGSICGISTSVLDSFCNPEEPERTAGGHEFQEIYCASNEICRDGVCVAGTRPGSCTDTDEENDIHVVGTVSGTDSCGESFSTSDACFNEASVTEKNCGGDVRFVCPSDEHCEQGRCVPGNFESPCTESDGGLDPNTAGTVSWTDRSGEVRNFNDYCTPWDLTRVAEFYCAEWHNETLISCAEDRHCEDGACRPGRCTDSDGSNRTTLGTVTVIDAEGNSAIHTDSCTRDGESAIEYVCTDGDSYETRTLACEGLQTCCNGACQTLVCRRTSPTETSAGFITPACGPVQPDICRDENLIRYECAEDGTVRELPPERCPSGCRDGLCL